MKALHHVSPAELQLQPCASGTTSRLVLAPRPLIFDTSSNDPLRSRAHTLLHRRPGVEPTEFRGRTTVGWVTLSNDLVHKNTHHMLEEHGYDFAEAGDVVTDVKAAAAAEALAASSKGKSCWNCRKVGFETNLNTNTVPRKTRMVLSDMHRIYWAITTARFRLADTFWHHSEHPLMAGFFIQYCALHFVNDAHMKAKLKTRYACPLLPCFHTPGSSGAVTQRSFSLICRVQSGQGHSLRLHAGMT